MADPFVSNLLHLWGMTVLQEDFQKQEIDQEGFEALDDSLIAELIPVIGRRAKFLKKFKNYKMMNSSPETTHSVTKVLHLSTPLGNDSEVVTESDMSETVSFLDITKMEPSSDIDEADIQSRSDILDCYDIAGTSQVESGSVTCSASLDILPKQKGKYTKSIPGCHLNYPTPIPAFTSDMQRIIDDGELVLHSKKFIRVFANFLLTITDRPSRADYAAYCRTLVEKFPELQDGSQEPYMGLKRRISKHLRNARYHSKIMRKRTATTTSGNCKLAPFASLCSTSSAAVLKDSSAKEIFPELQGYSNTAHPQTKLLLKKSLNIRRKWVTKEATGPKDVIEKFPHLKKYVLFMYDFELLALPCKPMDHFEGVIKRLDKLFGGQSDNDHQKLQLFAKLEQQIHGRQPFALEPAVKVELAGEQTHLNWAGGSSPVVRVFSSGDGVLTDAFLVVEGQVITSIGKDITPYKCIHLLISSYFVLYVEYPKEYANFLNFLECEVLSRTPTGKSVTFFKFMNRYDDIKI